MVFNSYEGYFINVFIIDIYNISTVLYIILYRLHLRRQEAHLTEI